MNPPPNCKSEERSITFSTHREEKMEAQAGQQQWMMSAQAQPQYAYGAPPPPPPQHYHQPSSHEEIRTLWIGDLPYWADESYLHSWFAATTEVLSIKVIRNKATGISEGYGFLEFASHSTAERALRSYNGTQIPGTELTFWLNWASSGIGERRPDAGPEHSYAYKFGYSEAGTFSYYDYCDDYPIYDQTMGINEYTRQLDVNQRTTSEHTRQNEQLSSSFRANPPECLESNHDGGESLHVWEDNVDLDNMTYEELIELGEMVGSQSRGLSQEAISLLPISKFKCGLFWRNFWKKKSRDERCVICQMEYKRGDRQITLPCTHVYHATCGNQWLTINKVCPICYKDVHVDVSPSKREERFR